jgi:hypothetical protein
MISEAGTKGKEKNQEVVTDKKSGQISNLSPIFKYPQVSKHKKLILL